VSECVCVTEGGRGRGRETEREGGREGGKERGRERVYIHTVYINTVSVS